MEKKEECNYFQEREKIFKEREQLVATFIKEKNDILRQISVINNCIEAIKENSDVIAREYSIGKDMFTDMQERFDLKFEDLKGTFENRIKELQDVNIEKDFLNHEQDLQLETITADLYRIQSELSKRIDDINNILGADFKDEIIRRLIDANESVIFDKMEFVKTSITEIKNISSEIKNFKDHISRIEGIYGSAIDKFAKINTERERIDNLDKADRRSNIVKVILAIIGFIAGIATPELFKLISGSVN